MAKPTQRVFAVDKDGLTEVFVPARKSLLFMILFGAWCVFGLLINVAMRSDPIYSELMSAPIQVLHLVVPVAFFTVGALVLWWMFMGREVVSVDQHHLVHRAELGPLRRVQKLERHAVTNARWRKGGWGSLLPVYLFGHRMVVTHHHSDVQLAYGCDESEVEYLRKVLLIPVTGSPQ
ncbi:MAG: hypothetical protein KI785_10130 [Devosiaceae bacterium]|nr:hypothetical protein [Devosiaceae bacterium MH13]